MGLPAAPKFARTPFPVTLGWRPLGKMESEPAVLEPLERSIRSSFLSRSFEGGQREG